MAAEQAGRVMIPAEFIAETHRAIADSALMLAGTDPQRREKWLLDRHAQREAAPHGHGKPRNRIGPSGLYYLPGSLSGGH
jgi:hypothetical protein